MRKESRTAVYDDKMRLEACRFEGIVQPFPAHFHEYYVIGLVEGGRRCLSCKNQNYTIARGDVLLFNPGDSHACAQRDEGALDYFSFHIDKEIMAGLAEAALGGRILPEFSQSVISDEEIFCCLRSLHRLVMNGSSEFGEERTMRRVMSLLIRRYGQPFEPGADECREEIERACFLIEQNYSRHIDLEQICRLTNLSKSTLLRTFVKEKGYSLPVPGGCPH